MANKVFRIPKNELPPVKTDNTYSVRFRVISEDKNRVSHWSRIFDAVAVTSTPITDYAITKDSPTKVVNLIWNPGLNNAETSFDIYIKWVGQAGVEGDYDYSYAATTTNNIYSTIHPTQVTNPLNPLLQTNVQKVRMKVQKSTFPKELSASALLFETSLTTI